MRMSIEQVVFEIMQFTHLEEVKNVIFTCSSLYNECKASREKLRKRQRKELFDIDTTEMVIREWYPDGQLARRIPFSSFHYQDSWFWLEAISNGRVEGWFPNGVKQYEHNYRNGKLHGTKIDYTPDGTVRSYERYNLGVLLNTSNKCALRERKQKIHCTRCGNDGHWKKTCSETKNVFGVTISYDTELEEYTELAENYTRWILYA